MDAADFFTIREALLERNCLLWKQQGKGSRGDLQSGAVFRVGRQSILNKAGSHSNVLSRARRQRTSGLTENIAPPSGSTLNFAPPVALRW